MMTDRAALPEAEDDGTCRARVVITAHLFFEEISAVFLEDEPGRVFEHEVLGREPLFDEDVPVFHEDVIGVFEDDVAGNLDERHQCFLPFAMTTVVVVVETTSPVVVFQVTPYLSVHVDGFAFLYVNVFSSRT